MTYEKEPNVFRTFKRFWFFEKASNRPNSFRLPVADLVLQQIPFKLKVSTREAKKFKSFDFELLKERSLWILGAFNLF